jgi:hypothetical protein
MAVASTHSRGAGDVTRAISGHATEAMHQHYSTVAASEMRAGLAQIVSIAGVRAAQVWETWWEGARIQKRPVSVIC